jgi:hypothetical protein
MGASSKGKATQTDIKNVKKISKLDGDLFYYINRHSKKMSNESMNDLNNEILMRKHFDDMFAQIISGLDIVDQKKTDFDCYKALVNQF